MNFDDKRKFFIENGYIVLKSFFDSQTIINLRDTFIKNANSNNEIFNFKFVENLFVNEKFVQEIKNLLNSDKLLYFSDSNIVNHKKPLTESNGWHNDSRFEDENIPYNQEYPILRIALYFEDHKNFSGGLKIKKKSHKYFCFNWRAPKQNLGKLFNIFFKKTKYNLSSLKNGKGINLDLQEGDLVVWNLRTHHSGMCRRLKLFPEVCLHPLIEKRLPLFLFKKTKYISDRCSLFSTFATNDLENKNILGYVKNKINLNKIKELKNNSELIDKFNRLGINIPEF